MRLVGETRGSRGHEVHCFQIPRALARGSMWCRQEEAIIRVKVRLSYMVGSHRFRGHFQELTQLTMFTVLVKCSQTGRGLSTKVRW